MEEIITKEIAQKLMEIKGEVRGVAIKNHGEFIVKERGEKGLNKLKDMMTGLGYPIKYKAMGSMKFYPMGLEAVELLAIKKAFNFNEEKFKEIGIFGSKVSLIMRLFMKYFFSIKLMIKQVPKIWGKNYTIGNLKVAEFNEKKKYIILKLEDFHLHPIHCLVLEGYFSNVIKMIVKDTVTCQETKCIHKGDEYHEFLFKW